MYFHAQLSFYFFRWLVLYLKCSTARYEYWSISWMNLSWQRDCVTPYVFGLRLLDDMQPLSWDNTGFAQWHVFSSAFLFIPSQNLSARRGVKHNRVCEIYIFHCFFWIEEKYLFLNVCCITIWEHQVVLICIWAFSGSNSGYVLDRTSYDIHMFRGGNTVFWTNGCAKQSTN